MVQVNVGKTKRGGKNRRAPLRKITTQTGSRYGLLLVSTQVEEYLIKLFNGKILNF